MAGLPRVQEAELVYVHAAGTQFASDAAVGLRQVVAPTGGGGAHHELRGVLRAVRLQRPVGAPDAEARHVLLAPHAALIAQVALDVETHRHAEFARAGDGIGHPLQPAQLVVVVVVAHAPKHARLAEVEDVQVVQAAEESAVGGDHLGDAPAAGGRIAQVTPGPVLPVVEAPLEPGLARGRGPIPGADPAAILRQRGPPVAGVRAQGRRRHRDPGPRLLDSDRG